MRAARADSCVWELNTHNVQCLSTNVWLECFGLSTARECTKYKFMHVRVNHRHLSEAGYWRAKKARLPELESSHQELDPFEMDGSMMGYTRWRSGSWNKIFFPQDWGVSLSPLLKRSLFSTCKETWIVIQCWPPGSGPPPVTHAPGAAVVVCPGFG